MPRVTLYWLCWFTLRDKQYHQCLPKINLGVHKPTNNALIQLKSFELKVYSKECISQHLSPFCQIKTKIEDKKK